MPTSARTLPVAVRTRGAAADRGALRVLLRRCLDSGNTAPGTGVGLVLAGDRLVRRLNREWRGKDCPTDVLSFPAGDPPPLPSGAEKSFPPSLGEIVISVPRCREQAAKQGVDPGVELARLVIHGVLHLMGFDHEEAMDRVRMQARERKLRAWAARSGIGPGMLSVPRSVAAVPTSRSLFPGAPARWGGSAE
jgi:probable rRNA maturation factor